MRLSVASSDAAKFLARGESAYQKIKDVLARTGLPLSPGQNVLEWGCGCGRIARHFASAGVDFTGIDINHEAVNWCQENLAFGTFLVCALVPPTELPSEAFDVVYAGSVLTHLSAPSQFRWMAELHRVLKPNGRLILTFHGAFYIARHHMRDGFKFCHIGSGLFADAGLNEGSNAYGAYQTREATREIFFPFRELLHIQMHDILGGQDTIVLEKRPGGLSDDSNHARRATVVLTAGEAGSGAARIEVVDDGMLLGATEVGGMLADQRIVVDVPLSSGASSSATAKVTKGDCAVESIWWLDHLFSSVER